MLILDIMRRNKTQDWVETMSKVLANLLALVERAVPSVFAALLLYVETATSRKEILPVHTRVLTAVLDLYAEFLEEGMSPTFDELGKRPVFGTTSFKDGANARSKDSDLYRFATLMVSGA